MSEVLIGNLGDLAMMAGMPSEPTLRKLIEAHADFPIRARGKNGQSYEFDLGAAWQFVTDLKRAEEEEARRHSEAVRQLGLDLLGDGAMSAQIGGAVVLSPAERKAVLEEELVAIKLAEKRGELVRKIELEAALGELLVWFQQQGKSFTARLSKRVHVDRETLAEIDRMIVQDQAKLAARMRKMGEIPDSAASADNDPAV